mmetsp:Transcript_50577/g.120637  ORF Transcript_50577/g.120637 Transcript_50577/m.120637 type:complete len:475 (+) Transcript_50577:89-1513(+)
MPSLRSIQLHGSPFVFLSGKYMPEVLSQSFYHATILPLALLTGLLGYGALPSRAEWPKNFHRFMATYLSAWTLCVAADWLQGPYVYALYEAYGFSSHEIAQLFVAGFGSALLCSCFVGGLADRFGRKRGCIAYCLLYMASCATKHWKSYWILMLGRVTGGFATSLLFSCFECWMVSEHTVRNKFSSSLLSYMFGMKFTIMYLVAIASGFVAQGGVDSTSFAPVSENSTLYFGGNLVPFDMSACVLVFALLIITLVWEENYGDDAPDAEAQTAGSSLMEGLTTMCRSAPLLSLCLLLSCFEGAMYAFVFNWTPALETDTEMPPHGVVFALMMMACMCGASISTLVADKVSPLRRLQLIAVLGLGAFAVATMTASRPGGAHVCFLSFLVFEFCVGVYFPSIGTLKSELVPERIRATMYNICRVPLNAVVVSLLLTDLTVIQCFRFCALLMGAVFVAGFGIRKSYCESVPEDSVKAK